MKGTKHFPSQRRLALRRGLVVLGLVLVCGAGWCCSHLSRLTPALVVRSAEQTLACGPTEVLAERRDQGETFLLSQNHAVVMLNVFSPAFWTADLLPGQPLFAVDRTKVTGPAAAGEYQFYDGEAQRGYLHVAGVLTGCPEAVSVRLCLPEIPDTPWAEVPVLESTDGVRYFWYREATGPEGFLPGFTTVLLLGPTGETLASCPITDPGNFLALHYNGSPLASALPTEGTS